MQEIQILQCVINVKRCFKVNTELVDSGGIEAKQTLPHSMESTHSINPSIRWGVATTLCCLVGL